MSSATRGQIIFIGEYRFPDGDANAIRQLSLARMCHHLGFEVVVMGKGTLRPSDYDNERAGYYYDNVRYDTMNPVPVSTYHRLRHPIQRLRLYVNVLRAIVTDQTRAVVISACDAASHLPGVQSFCRSRGIPLIADVNEWFEPHQRKYGRLNPTYAVFRNVFRYVIPRCSNMIVVSKLLENHFARPGLNLIRVPAPFDVEAIDCTDRTRSDKIVFLYAGSPGRKDLLREMLEALQLLNPEERERIEFNIIGMTGADLARSLGGPRLLSELGETVKVRGRVSHGEVLRALQEAHFSVLLRPNRRYANAGFPSKVAESLAAGTPVFLNYTSDLEHYLGDGRAAVAVQGYSPGEIAAGLRSVLQLNRNELAALRAEARAKAEKYFDYRAALPEFGMYLARLR